MLEEVVVIVWVEQRFDSKNLWTTVFCTSKYIAISEASTNGI